nr:Ig-like domain-containing protein [Lachnospiraceae bacterium]
RLTATYTDPNDSTNVLSGYTDITVTAVPVTGITIKNVLGTEAPSSIDITAGYTFDLTPTIAPNNASFGVNDITWVSSNTSTATVNSSGRVTAVAPGTARIKAKIAGGGAGGADVESAEFTVSVYKKPTLTFNATGGTLAASLPDKVYLDLTSDSTNLKSVSGGSIVLKRGSTTAELSSGYQTQGKSFTVAKDVIDKAVNDYLKGSFTEDTETVTAYLYPYGTSVSNDSTRNEALYATAEIKYYKTKFEGENATITYSSNDVTGTTKYLMQGTTLKMTAKAASGYNSIKWDDNSSTNTSREETVSGAKTYKVLGVRSSSSSSSSGSSSGAGTGGTGGTGGSGYDRVPKTGESNAIFGIIMLMVACAIGAVWYSYRIYTPKAETAGALSSEQTSGDSEADKKMTADADTSKKESDDDYDYK